MKGIYLDNAATTPVATSVLDAMLPYYQEEYGNPSSIYTFSSKPRNALAKARSQVAQLINSKSDHIIFNSGCTEGNNTVLKSVLHTDKKHIITTQIEHSSVRNVCYELQTNNIPVSYIAVDNEGFINFQELLNSITKDTALISIIQANNEIGTIQNVQPIVQLARSKNILVHIDATQAIGKIPIDVQSLDVDFLTMSAHKIYGPKGVGALYVKDYKNLSPLFTGGEQEFGYRAGTENVPGIVGLGKAAELALESIDDEPNRLRFLQEKTFEMLSKYSVLQFNGPMNLEKRIQGNINFSVVDSPTGESFVMQLFLQGFAVSTGSACAGHKLSPSHVLLAIGQSIQGASNAVRITFGKQNTLNDVEKLNEALDKIFKTLATKS